MQKQGTVVRWDAQRAFGFIRSTHTNVDLFFHVRDFRGAAPPQEGLRVGYDEVLGGSKGPRAVAVVPLLGSFPNAMPPDAQTRSAGRDRGPPPSPPPRASAAQARHSVGAGRDGRSRSRAGSAGAVWVMVWLAALAWGWSQGLVPWWALAALAVVNGVTFAAYAIDKRAAKKRTWRTPENHLHLLSFIGGWPAAGAAQQWLRHKSSKTTFRTLYWVTVLLHCIFLGAWLFGSQPL